MRYRAFSNSHSHFAYFLCISGKNPTELKFLQIQSAVRMGTFLFRPTATTDTPAISTVCAGKASAASGGTPLVLQVFEV
jgi:hypothetical protein